jgi:anti-anti-sigma factor
MNSGIDVWRAEPGVAIIALEGEHDDYSSGKLARELAAALDEELHVIVDLRRTTFLDSTSVSTLLSAKRSADEHGVDLAVVIDEVTPWPVRRLFELAHLGEVLPIVPGVDAALARTRAGWLGAERRSFRDRRTGSDRRIDGVERPIGPDRRVGERRSGRDRRA